VEEVRNFFLVFGLLCSSGMAFAQYVCAGTVQQCVEAQKKLCAGERVSANLKLGKAAQVRGVVSDKSGEAFASPFQLQLRDVKTGAILQNAVLNKDGRFSLNRLNQGEYRLILVKVNGNTASRPDLFDQPVGLQCDDRDICDLQIVLDLHATDNPIDFCPPK
jgi:hypothetical protein